MPKAAVWMPPEWQPQDWIWIGFPHDAVEWPGFLERAQEQIAAFANAVAESGQEVRLIVRDEANAARARSLVSSAVKTSPKFIGTALVPSVLKVSRKMLFCITRTFTPSKSSALVTGRLLLVRLRNPFSQ